MREGKTPQQILDLIPGEARPHLRFQNLLRRAEGRGGLRKHGRDGKASTARRPSSRRNWTEAERLALRTYTQDGRSMLDLATELNRTVSSVRLAKTNLLRRLNPWTAEQVDILQQMTTDARSIANIAEVLGRTPQGVFAKQADLGFVPRLNQTSRHRWSDQNMDELLLLYKEGLSDGEIARKLSFKVTVKAVVGKRQQLGLAYPSATPKSWTTEQIDVLQDLLSRGLSNKDIGLHIGRPTSQVRDKSAKLGMRRRSSKPSAWAIADEEKLRELHHAEYSIREIIQNLSMARSVASVTQKLNELGLYRRKRPTFYTREEVDIIRDSAEKGLSNKQIRDRLGGTRSGDSVTKTLNALGYKRSKAHVEGLVQRSSGDTSDKTEEYTKEEVDIVRDSAEKGLINKQI